MQMSKEEAKAPRIAILMAIYEPRMDWLEAQLRSLDAQTYPNLRLYIRDDCSPTVSLDAIAACVVGGISFKGGIGKIQGIVVGVLVFTALTYSLTILGVDTNLQFVFSGIIILSAVTIDCLKYVQKK